MDLPVVPQWVKSKEKEDSALLNQEAKGSEEKSLRRSRELLSFSVKSANTGS